VLFIKDGMGLGLEKGTVSIQPYDSAWALSFKKEKESLEQLFNSSLISVVHFGSTAIPGCDAKPIIDIVAVIEVGSLYNIPWRELRNIDYGNSWVHCLPDRFTLAKGSPTTHHLHIVQIDSYTLFLWLLFKRILLNNTDIRIKYETLKNNLAKIFPNDRTEYTKGKSAFINSEIKRVLSVLDDNNLSISLITALNKIELRFLELN
jgi:GrpB-like predicted nucleotidyltransferase (UPF0157 family)